MNDKNESQRFMGTKYLELVKPYLNIESITISGDELNCCCPFHKEKHPSFSINLDTGLYYCHACEAKGNIIDFVSELKNISKAEAREFIKNETGIDPYENIESNLSYTLEDYAAEKHLDVEFLKQRGVFTANNGKSVAIQYYNENKQLVRTRYRNNPNSTIRFYWDNVGTGTCLYGIWSLNIYNTDYVVLVERRKRCSNFMGLWSTSHRCSWS